MVDRHARRLGPWRRRRQSGRSRIAARNTELASAGRAAVAADRRASVRSLQRSDADHGGAGRLYQRHLLGAVLTCRRYCRAAVRRGRASRASRRTGARHNAGAGGIAGGRLAAAVVRAAAIAAEPRQLDGRSVRRQVDAEIAGGAGSVDRRSAPTSENSLRAPGKRTGGSEAGVPAAGAGWARPRTDVTRGQRSVRAAAQIAVSDAMDAVASVAVAGVFGLAALCSDAPVVIASQRVARTPARSFSYGGQVAHRNDGGK